jgi:hypothetical protein
MKPRFLLGLIIVLVVCGSAWLLIRGRYAHPQHQQVSPTRDEYGLSQPASGDVTVRDNSSANNTETKTLSPGPEIAPEQTPVVPPVVREAPPVVAPAPAQPAERPRAKAGAENSPAEPLVPKPIARTALGYVGADEDAEEVWVNAINDPNRSANERKDLIEDLNEDGFPDPKHITQEDLPLIVSRLMLIEELAPDAIDDVNAAAFAEAYKDLANMLERLGRN